MILNESEKQTKLLEQLLIFETAKIKHFDCEIRGHDVTIIFGDDIIGKSLLINGSGIKVVLPHDYNSGTEDIILLGSRCVIDKRPPPESE